VTITPLLNIILLFLTADLSLPVMSEETKTIGARILFVWRSSWCWQYFHTHIVLHH